ncbi:hypothetical protein [Schlegelella aquatica]|uniref:hypothetical protein n=1 Tax=Caldimonas aquatica TaxID=376175 RepID=UPI0037523213
MSISRHALYAAGEPFGSSCTRREAGRVVYGGGGDSESTQTTNNIDRRVAVQDGIGISGDRNAVSVTTNVLDAGAVKGALDFSSTTVDRALNSVDTSNATLGQGYGRLLDAAEKLFERGESLIGQTQKSVADAYDKAQLTAKGTIDNRTIVVLAVAGAAALAFMGRK